jgi:hypothetical protein
MPSNLPPLEEAAAKLKHLLLEVIFVDGSTLDLIVTDQASAPIRRQTWPVRTLNWKDS